MKKHRARKRAPRPPISRKLGFLKVRGVDFISKAPHKCKVCGHEITPGEKTRKVSYYGGTISKVVSEEYYHLNDCTPITGRGRRKTTPSPAA